MNKNIFRKPHSFSSQTRFHRGFTLVELIISIFIMSVLAIAVGSFQKDVFSLSFVLQNSLNAQLDARHLTKVMVAEIREASPSSVGAYPIALASSTGITFYSDINADGLKEKVRYYLNGTSIKKGVVVPTGSPLVYDDVTEKTTTLISNVVASSTLPLFQYYPSTYTGTTSPLSYPMNIPSIRLVKITVIIDKDPTHSPGQLIVTSSVSIRNLKDNL